MPVNKTLLSRAQSAVISRDFELAVRLYKEMLQESPDDIELLRQMGNLYVKSGKDGEAFSVFNRIITLSPKDVDALISIGGIYRRQKKYNESIAVLERALATGTNNTQVSYNLGFTFKQMGSYDDAIACFEDVVDQNQNDVLAFNHIGAIYAERNQHEEAINTYLRGLKTDPNHPILQMNLAKSYEAIGGYSKAVVAYAAALKAKPGWLECIDNYSKLLLKLNRVRDAYDLINGALRLNAEDAKMHTRMGDVYMRQSIFPDAEKEYKTALYHDEEYIPALEGLVDSQEEQGKTEEAVQTIQKIEKIAPDNPTVMQKSASVYLSANRLSAAYEKIMQLMDSSPRDVQTLSLLGQYYISNGEWEQAEETLQKIIAIEPTYSEFYREGAKRFEQKGNSDQAKKYLQMAIAQNPHDSKALTQLGLLYEKNNQIDKAYDAYRKASVVDVNNNQAKQSLLRVRSINPELGLYDAPPVMEMQNDEIRDEVILPKPILPQAPETEEESSFGDDVFFEEDVSDDFGKAQNPSAYSPSFEENDSSEEIDELPSVGNEMNMTMMDRGPVLDFSDDDAVETLFAEKPAPSEEPMPKEQKKKSADFDAFSDDFNNAFSPFVDDDFENTFESASQKSVEKNRSERAADEYGQDSSAVSGALSRTLNKIAAQVDKATMAAADAWRAAKKAADYAQAAEDASHAIPEKKFSEHEESSGSIGEDSSAVEDDLDKLAAEPLFPLPEEPAESNDEDISNFAAPIFPPEEPTEVTDKLENFKASLALFKTLRAMTEDLPEEKRNSFKDSYMCEVLNNIIAKLEE